MSRFASKRINDMEGYRANPNIYAVKLDANESCYPISDSLKKCLCEAIMNDSLTVYPDPMAEKVCRKYAALIGVKPEQVVAGDGSDELINVICSCFLSPGDKVLYFTPDFSMYEFYADVKGNEVIAVPKGDDLRLTKEMILENYKKYLPKLIFFSNPCNPTGCGLSADDVLEVVKTANDAIVVVDEAYMDFWDQSVLSHTGEFDNLIILKTCSKAFSLAAVRLGFAVADRGIIDIIKKVKSPYNVNVITQLAGQVCLDSDDYVKENIKKIEQVRGWFFERVQMLAQKSGAFTPYESGANFIYMKMERWKELDAALKEKGVVIRTYGNGYIRISIGTKEQMELVYSVMEAVFG